MKTKKKVYWRDLIGLTSDEAKLMAHKINDDPKCPVCDGDGLVPDDRVLGREQFTFKKTCPTCRGSGYED